MTTAIIVTDLLLVVIVLRVQYLQRSLEIGCIFHDSTVFQDQQPVGMPGLAGAYDLRSTLRAAVISTLSGSRSASFV